MLTVFLFFGIVLLIMAGIFSFFSHTLRFIDRTDYFNDAVLLYLYELFMFAVFLLVFASALITGLFGLFSGQHQLLLAVSPKYSLIPVLVLARMFITSLWPILILVLPALFAIAITYPLSFVGALMSLVSLILFVLLAVISALSLILGIAWLILRLKPSFLHFHTLSFVVLLIGALLFSFMWHSISDIRLTTLFKAEAVELTQADSGLIQNHFSMLPSHPTAMILFSAGKDDLAEILKNVVVLSFFVGTATFVFLIFRRYHLVLWQIFQLNQVSKKSTALTNFETLLARANGPQSALFRRELVTFFRNTNGMTWFGFFTLIWFFQVGSMFILDNKLSERPTTLPFLVIALQVAATIYFVNMFVLRFAFPTFSMDQKMSRIVQSAPVDTVTLFFGRIRFYVPLIAFLGLIFTLLNTFILEISTFGTLVILGCIFLATVSVTLYGLALGALFPNYETSDPEILSTSLPGLTFIFTSLLYGSFAAFAVRSNFVDPGNPFIFLFIFISLGVSILSILVPKHKLAERA